MAPLASAAFARSGILMRFAIPLMLLGFATPALAADAAIPEPSSMALFGLGVLGVIIGRRGARRRRD
jgi:hypothetical protein